MEEKAPIFSYEGEGAVYPEIFNKLVALDQGFSDKYKDLEYHQYSLNWDTYKKELDTLKCLCTNRSRQSI